MRILGFRTNPRGYKPAVQDLQLRNRLNCSPPVVVRLNNRRGSCLTHNCRSAQPERDQAAAFCGLHKACAQLSDTVWAAFSMRMRQVSGPQSSTEHILEMAFFHRNAGLRRSDRGACPAAQSEQHKRAKRQCSSSSTSMAICSRGSPQLQCRAVDACTTFVPRYPYR